MDRKYDSTKNHEYVEVYQYDYYGENLIKVFPSIKAASEELKICIANIYSCCLDKRSHAGGFVWRKGDVKNAKRNYECTQSIG